MSHQRGKPKNVEESVRKNVYLPRSLVARVEVSLFDETRGKARYGSFSQLVTTLLDKWAKGEILL